MIAFCINHVDRNFGRANFLSRSFAEAGNLVRDLSASFKILIFTAKTVIEEFCSEVITGSSTCRRISTFFFGGQDGWYVKPAAHGSHWWSPLLTISWTIKAEVSSSEVSRMVEKQSQSVSVKVKFLQIRFAEKNQGWSCATTSAGFSSIRFFHHHRQKTQKAAARTGKNRVISVLLAA